jgi:8-oxo-dGTP diphosphatase
MTAAAHSHDLKLDELLKTWSPDLIGTLCFVVDSGRVLLIEKKRGHGAGLINGPGGKLEAGETPLQCAIRETQEETCVLPIEPQLQARFKFVDLVAAQWFGYIYVAHAHQGTARETAEGAPLWVDLQALPFAQMWPDDRYWLPRLLAGEKLEGEFLFDDGQLLTHRLRPAAAS